MIGSPGIGMLEFCIALSEGYLEKDDAIIFVAMDTSPMDIIAMMETFGLPMDELLGKRIFFLDYHSCLLGSNMDRSGNVDGVRTISDLEGIMFNITAISEETGKRLRIFFHSLSTLFLYNQSNVVLKFFQITCSRIRSQYGTAIVAVHEGVHDERTVNHLMAIADGTVELRFDEDLNKMMRIRNMRGYPTSPNWIPFEIKNLSKNEDARLLEWI
jgi:KaiC/GvpD/RAD55 family RecA-like ATPase